MAASASSATTAIHGDMARGRRSSSGRAREVGHRLARRLRARQRLGRDRVEARLQLLAVARRLALDRDVLEREDEVGLPLAADALLEAVPHVVDRAPRAPSSRHRRAWPRAAPPARRTAPPARRCGRGPSRTWSATSSTLGSVAHRVRQLGVELVGEVLGDEAHRPLDFALDASLPRKSNRRSIRRTARDTPSRTRRGRRSASPRAMTQATFRLPRSQPVFQPT